jgi:hypothetical protein
MSIKTNLSELRQTLERWKSHNEVHAKPADNVLYDFLNGFLKLAEGDLEPKEFESPKETQSTQMVAEKEPEAQQQPEVENTQLPSNDTEAVN